MTRQRLASTLTTERSIVTEPRSGGVVVGATKLAFMFGKSRGWAIRLLNRWELEQRDGGPVRVFRAGDGSGGRYTTLAVIRQWMPPGRDLELYRRVRQVEEDLADTTRRLDREVAERMSSVSELSWRVAGIATKA
jgi:hypothetical protein